MKKTSIEWLFEQIPFEFTSSKAAFEALQIAKEIHQKEIIEAFNQGYRKGNSDAQFEVFDGDIANFSDAKIYYNQTFNK